MITTSCFLQQFWRIHLRYFSRFAELDAFEERRSGVVWNCFALFCWVDSLDFENLHCQNLSFFISRIYSRVSREILDKNRPLFYEFDLYEGQYFPSDSCFDPWFEYFKTKWLLVWKIWIKVNFADILFHFGL